MIWSALSTRPSSFGFRLMKMFAWFAPPPPTNMPTSAMPRSARSTSATCCALSAVLAKEESCEVTNTPERKPVSCCGKKPVGTVA